MKISIITPAWNAADTLCDTIASVIDQTYNDIEYILVDRESTDETLSVFLSMRHGMDINRTKHITVQTKNVFQAIEKGVENATGDIIAILGAGDFYSSDDVLSSVMEQFSTGDIQMVYGDMKFVNADNTQKVTRRTCGRFYRRWPKVSGMTQCHPALFFTKELFQRSGGFRKDFKLAADYEMMVRLLSDRNHHRKYLRKEMVSIRQYKVNSSEAEAYRKELVKAFEVNDLPQQQTNPLSETTDAFSATKEKVQVQTKVPVKDNTSKDAVKETGKKKETVKDNQKGTGKNENVSTLQSPKRALRQRGSSNPNSSKPSSKNTSKKANATSNTTAPEKKRRQSNGKKRPNKTSDAPVSIQKT